MRSFFHRKRLFFSLPGMTTVEVMVMMVATSVVVFSSYGAKFAAFQSYHRVVNRERALLFAAETLEQFEAMKRTRIQQNYIESWDLFLGAKAAGNYQLVSSQNLSDLNLVRVSDDFVPSDEDPMMVRFYDNEDDQDGFYARLERRITVEELEQGVKKVSVFVSWGEALGEQVQLQAVYADQVGAGFAL